MPDTQPEISSEVQAYTNLRSSSALSPVVLGRVKGMELAAGVELSTEPMKPLPLQIFSGTPVGPETE